MNVTLIIGDEEKYPSMAEPKIHYGKQRIDMESVYDLSGMELNSNIIAMKTRVSRKVRRRTREWSNEGEMGS